jgi:hypothetical protein
MAPVLVARAVVAVGARLAWPLAPTQSTLARAVVAVEIAVRQAAETAVPQEAPGSRDNRPEDQAERSEPPVAMELLAEPEEQARQHTMAKLEAEVPAADPLLQRRFFPHFRLSSNGHLAVMNPE